MGRRLNIILLIARPRRPSTADATLLVAKRSARAELSIDRYRAHSEAVDRAVDDRDCSSATYRKAPTSPAPSPATRCTTSAGSSPSRARSCRATSSPPTAAPASSTWRPTMARTISSCARRNGIDPVFAVEADGKYREDWLWLGGQGSRSSTPSSTRPTGRSAPTCARPARCSPRAPTTSTAIRTAGGRRPRSSTAARRNGSCAMDKPLAPSTHAQDAAPSSAGRMRAARCSTARTATTRPRRCASSRWTRSRETRFVPEKGRNRIGSMVEGRPDWVLSRQRAWGVPIALFVERKTGELPGRSRGQRADRRRDPRAGRRRLGRRATPQDFLGNALRRRRLRAGHRHSRRLVRQRLHPCLHAGKRPLARAALAGRPLPRRLRPASRLVPVVAARKLRHARPRAVQRGADPRLHDGRQGHEDVQEPRQHDRSARPDAATMAPTSSGCGRCRSTSPRTTASARRSSRGVADQYRKLRNTFRYLLGALDGFERERAGRGRRRCPSWSATCWRCSPSSTRRLQAGGRRLRLQHLHPRADRLLQRGPVRLLSSISARTASTATRPATRSGAPIAPCSTRCSTRWSARRRRCWCSPPRKCGARAIPTRAACICSNGR